MKIILYSILVSIAGLFYAEANTPQKIYSINRQNLSAAYYHEQVILWQEELDKDLKNKDAWFNFFMANRVLFKKGKIDRSSFEKTNSKLQESIPNTFEAYFAEHSISSEISSLLKAYESAPQRYETYPDLISHYEQIGERNKVAQLCKKWLDSGEYSSGLLKWNYNALMGLEKNALIITEGDNHTHPLWLLQYGKNIREDVQVLNLNLLSDPNYKIIIFNELNIPNLESNEKANIVQHLLSNIEKKGIYVGISVPKELIREQENELFIIGLTFKHSNPKFDNISVLVDNYENKFLLNYLNVNLSPDISQDLVNQNNVNYLPSFLILHDYYKEQNDWEKANYIKILSLKIADAANKGQKLRDYLDKSFTSGNSKPLVDVSHREIEDAFIPLDYSHNLYAGVTEVSNGDYELYLTDLLKRKQFDELQRRKIYTTDWRTFLPSQQKSLSDEVLFKNGAPNEEYTPIKNISYESAVAYCEWLTAVYNNINHKKKQYKRVQFRLPTEKEWILAASAISPNSENEVFPLADDYKYPWQTGNSNSSWSDRNEKGCFLANFNTNNEAPCEDCKTGSGALDGAFFTTYVDAYFPNSYGLFNTIGNVAEMIQEKGKAKGGSWFHTSNESTFQSIQEYKEPQPYIGFRVFMEVIEEGAQENLRKGMMGPPGTLQLKGKLYMDESEIDNISWLEYLYWLKLNDPDNYDLALLDTTVWISDFSHNQPLVTHYHSHSAYRNYPVVGVSHSQAKDYCAWRTKVVNEMLLLNPNHQKRFGKVLYRLPTESEWEYAAQGGLDKREFPYGIEDLETNKGLKTVNLASKQNHNASDVTAPTSSYKANKKGYYNMIGNVAEMVNQEGISKGGSWTHSKEKSKITTKIPYTKAEAWLGFRCICETNQ